MLQIRFAMALCLTSYLHMLLGQPIHQHCKFGHHTHCPTALKQKFSNSARECCHVKEVTIPVVFHIVQAPGDRPISDEMVLDQLSIVNKSFSALDSDIKDVPMEFANLIPESSIKFCLAKPKTLGFSRSIVRRITTIEEIGDSHKLFYDSLGGSTIIHPGNILNIYVANLGSGILGYGRFPGAGVPAEDAVVISPDVFAYNESTSNSKGKVLVHEIGHYLGLLHPWGDDEECQDSDFVDDTPVQTMAYYGCPQYPKFSCGTPDLFMNYMDYVNDECMFMFTRGQMERMLNIIEEKRTNLLNGEHYCTSTTNAELNKDDYRLYPNPAAQYLKIEFFEPVGRLLDLSIIDASGSVILEKTIWTDDLITIPLTGIASGVLLVRIDKLTEIVVHI